MANQKGIIKLKGTLGDITFYKTKEGHMAREKGGIDAKRFRTDPAFKRTRENAKEFGQAGKDGQLIRRAFAPLTRGVSDLRLTSRLQQRLMQVVKTDTLHIRGERVATAGDLNLVLHFDFNIKASFRQQVFASQVLTWDRATGTCKVVFEPHVPEERVVAPPEATHYRLMLAAAALDFEGGTFDLKLERGTLLTWDGQQVGQEELEVTLEPNSTQPVFVVLGVAFFQEVNGAMYSLNNGSFNASSIELIDTL